MKINSDFVYLEYNSIINPLDNHYKQDPNYVKITLLMIFAKIKRINFMQ